MRRLWAALLLMLFMLPAQAQLAPPYAPLPAASPAAAAAALLAASAVSPCSSLVTTRAPKQCDDASAGFYAAGSVVVVPVTAGGSGYTQATTTAALSGGSCASYGNLQPLVYNGQVLGIQMLQPTEGCATPAAAPTCAITSTTGGSGATCATNVAPVGASWIDPQGRYYRLLRDTPGNAVWQQQYMPASVLPADTVSGAVFACGEDKLHAGATKGWNVYRADNSSSQDIGFVGNGLDYASLDAFAAGKPTTINTCYDQISTNNAVGQAPVGGIVAMTVKAGGSGYTQGAAVTFTNICAGTAPAATINVTAGAITSFTIGTAGTQCSITSSTTATVAGGTGATFSIQIGGQPQVPPIPVVGNGRGMLFNNVVENNSTSGNYRTPTGTFKFKQPLNFPTLAVNSNSVTIVALAAFGHSTRNVPVVELNGSPVFSLNQRTATAGLTISTASSNLTLPGYKEPITPTVVGVSASSTISPGIDIYATDGNDSVYRTPYTGNALTGGVIGCGTIATDGLADTDCGYIDIRDVVIFNRALSATEYQQVAISLYRQAGVYPQVQLNLIADGDSITEGAYGSLFMGWPRLLAAQLAQPVTIYNTALSGQTSGTSIGQAVAGDVQQLPSFVSLCTRPGFTIYDNMVGTNDVTVNVLAPQIFGNVNTLLNSMNAAGCGAVFSGTLLPRAVFNSTPAYEAVRQAFNASVRANGYPVIDWAGDPTMGNPSNVTNVSYYVDQATHPGYQSLGSGEGQGGYPYIAPLHALSINPLIKGR